MATCDVKLYRKRQILAELETDCGVPAILTANSGGVEVSVAPSVEAEVAMIDRDVARATLTKLVSIAGEVKGSAKFSTEFKGPGLTVGGALKRTPAIDKYLQACGMGTKDLKSFSFTGAPSKTVVAGSILFVGVDVASATKKAMVQVTFDGSDTKVFYTLETLSNGNLSAGFAAADTVKFMVTGDTVATTGVTFTGTEVTGAGTVYYPVSTSVKNITIRSEEDGYKKQIQNASGTFKFMADANGVGKFDFDFQGVISKAFIATLTMTTGEVLPAGTIISNAGGTIKAVLNRATVNTTSAQEIDFTYTTPIGGWIGTESGHFGAVAISKVVNGVSTAIGSLGATVGGSLNPVSPSGFGDWKQTTLVSGAFDTTTPQILQDARLRLNGYKPVFGSVSVDAGNQITVRKDGNSLTGLKTARITDRKPTGSADPEMMSQTDFDIFHRWFEGTPGQLEFRLGDGADGNSLFFWGVKAQFTGNSDGDRDGIAVVNSEFMFGGDYATNGDDEYSLVLY